MCLLSLSHSIFQETSTAPAKSNDSGSSSGGSASNSWAAVAAVSQTSILDFPFYLSFLDFALLLPGSQQFVSVDDDKF